MNNSQPLLKAQSPAALAEEYIINSIWNNYFPAGTDLPAERDLADKIGVTRTTLREVLQRLARDGWLNIQHGKSTRVNNIWETAGPNIIGTIIKLDKSMMPVIIANVVSLRARMAEYFIPEAIKLAPEASLNLFRHLDQLENIPEAFSKFDYQLLWQFTFISNKPVYGLILNSFKALYLQIAIIFFQHVNARQITFNLYHNLRYACEIKDHKKAAEYMIKAREESASLWHSMLENLPMNFRD